MARGLGSGHPDEDLLPDGARRQEGPITLAACGLTATFEPHAGKLVDNQLVIRTNHGDHLKRNRPDMCAVAGLWRRFSCRPQQTIAQVVEAAVAARRV